ncbi:MAG: M20/M25/M40 family metallo-hydrolase [Eudoraea sp.]|nr:M20/M25/M40 family metallo-hydrolase [Eudoraea sp.]NNJ40327.1 M20/M25/M40 family metallo-hydrolase [Eudoraea sp.]
MKRIVLLICVVLLAACSSLRKQGGGHKADNQTDYNQQEVLESSANAKSGAKFGRKFTDSLRMSGLVNYLASDVMKGRATGSPEIELAANFIEKTLEQNRIKPFYPGFRDTLENTKKVAYNIVGIIPGVDPILRDEYILIGAHYDHIGIVNRVNGDAIANGANDNASGTASLLELSRYFGRKKKNKRSLIFAFFSAEEQGLLGSRHLAQKLKEEGVNLYLMLNFEMTGVPMYKKDYLLYITGYDKSNLAEEANILAGENLIGYLPTEKQYNLFQRSDNYPFHRIYQIPSHTFCTFDFNNYPYYHKASDEPDKLAYAHMAEVVNYIIPVIEGLVNSTDQIVKLK